MSQRLIDANNVNPSEAFGGISDFAQDCRNAVVELLNVQPTIDPIHAAGACYCRECKNLKFSDCYGECGKGYMGVVRPTDFCSRGERRE